MTAIIIVQARLGSRRLPGKSLMPLAGKPLIQHVLDRCTAVREQHYTVLAVPYGDAEEFRAALPFPRNFMISAPDVPENDVHARFTETLKLYTRYMKPEVMVRICGDSPFIDPAVIGLHLRQFMCGEEQAPHFVSNTSPRTWPAGQCVEAIRVKTFLNGKRDEMDGYAREHVMTWYYSNTPRENLTNPAGDFSHENLCVDTQADFDRAADLLAARAA